MSLFQIILVAAAVINAIWIGDIALITYKAYRILAKPGLRDIEKINDLVDERKRCIVTLIATDLCIVAMCVLIRC